MTHDFMIYTETADLIVAGEQQWLIWNDKDGLAKGDLIRFATMTNEEIIFSPEHKIDEKTYEVTCVSKERGLEEGYCICGIREVKENDGRL